MSLIGGIGNLFGGAVGTVATTFGTQVGANLASKVVKPASVSSAGSYASSYTLKDQLAIDKMQQTAELQAKSAQLEYEKERLMAETGYSVAAIKGQVDYLREAGKLELEKAKLGLQAQEQANQLQLQTAKAYISADAQVAMEKARQEGQVTSALTSLVMSRLAVPSPVQPVVPSYNAPQQVSSSQDYTIYYVLAGAAALGLILWRRRN